MADEAVADIDQAPFTQAREQNLEADVRPELQPPCVALMRFKEKKKTKTPNPSCLTLDLAGIQRSRFCLG